jgi:sirohydrochlorin cobaltochelatase
MRYKEDGSVDWGNMWDSFCALAIEGGPPHRGDLLALAPDEEVEGACYEAAAAEICRGIYEVSGLSAAPGDPGWIAIDCPTAAMARWLADAVNEENVIARCADTTLFVPCGGSFTTKGEVKNVITAVAKTTHYWAEHVPGEVKSSLAMQLLIRGLVGRLPWRRRRAA